MHENFLVLFLLKYMCTEKPSCYLVSLECLNFFIRHWIEKKNTWFFLLAKWENSTMLYKLTCLSVPVSWVAWLA